MKRNIKSIYLFLITGFLGQLDVLAVEKSPHNVSVNNADSCLVCHTNAPEAKQVLNTKNHGVDLSQFQQDGIVMCTTCHAEEEGHIVGVTLDFPVPPDLPLGADNSISCVTCHYTHGDLYSDRPQASYSFMDSLLNAERLHKSFLIRRNNVNGELCLTCHNTEQSKK